MASQGEVCFNSTLVRLRPSKEAFAALIFNKFQFYISSIKTISTKTFFHGTNKFQFYISSIKTEAATGYSLVVGMFQFYISSIKTHEGL